MLPGTLFGVRINVLAIFIQRKICVKYKSGCKVYLKDFLSKCWGKKRSEMFLLKSLLQWRLLRCCVFAFIHLSYLLHSSEFLFAGL